MTLRPHLSLAWRWSRALLYLAALLLFIAFVPPIIRHVIAQVASSAQIGIPFFDANGNLSLSGTGTFGTAGNGVIKLPSTGGNTITIAATGSQQGGTLNPNPLLNAQGATILDTLTGPQLSVSNAYSCPSPPCDNSFAAFSTFEFPVGAGCAPTANGGACYDSTQNRSVLGGGSGTAQTGAIPKVLLVSRNSADKLCALHTDAGCENNVTDATVETAYTQNYTIPANYFIANKVIRVSATWDLTTSAAAPTFRMRIRLGGLAGTTVFDSAAVIMTNAQTTRVGGAQFTFMGTGPPAVGANIETGGILGLASPTSINVSANTIAQPVAVNTTISEALTFTILFGANTTGNSLTLRSLIVEELN